MKKLFLLLSCLLVLTILLCILIPASGGVQLNTDTGQPSLVSAVNANDAAPVLTRDVTPLQNNAAPFYLIIFGIALVVGIFLLSRKTITYLKRTLPILSGANTDRRAILNCPPIAG